MPRDPMTRPDDAPGFIVAWRDRYEHQAGRLLDQVMTYGEAKKKAEEMQAKDSGKFYWAEPQPEEFKPH